MIDITTALVFGYKLNADTVRKIQAIDEVKYFDMLDDDFLHEASGYEVFDSVFGITVKTLETNMPFIYTMEELTKMLDRLDDKDFEMFDTGVKFLRDNNLLETDITPQLFLINKVW